MWWKSLVWNIFFPTPLHNTEGRRRLFSFDLGNEGWEHNQCHPILVCPSSWLLCDATFNPLSGFIYVAARPVRFILFTEIITSFGFQTVGFILFCVSLHCEQSTKQCCSSIPGCLKSYTKPVLITPLSNKQDRLFTLRVDPSQRLSHSTCRITHEM